MKSYYINKKNYYLADDLMINRPSFFKGCKTSRSIINRNVIPDNKYTFARLIDNQWIKSDGKSKKFDKLFISMKWFNDTHGNDKEDLIEDAPPEILSLHECPYDTHE